MEILLLFVVVVVVVIGIFFGLWTLDEGRRRVFQQKEDERKKVQQQKEDERRKVRQQEEDERRKVLLSERTALQLALDESLNSVVVRHSAILTKKRGQTLYLDDYGVLCGFDKWVSELRYFRENVVMVDTDVEQRLSAFLNNPICQEELADYFKEFPQGDDILGCSYPILGNDLSFFAEMVNSNILDELASQWNSTAPDIENMTGAEYEVYCATLLEGAGWSVIRKGGSGDQGVDLIATIADLRLAVQCKRYGQPVGNKAVQEVSAGRKFEQCDLAMVVSNADYTPSARRLASVLGVRLLHHSDLLRLSDVLEQEFPAVTSGDANV